MSLVEEWEKKELKSIEKLPDILTSNETSEEKINKIKALNGFAEKTATLFVEKIPQFMEFIENTNLQSKLKNLLKTIVKKNKII